jgi:hypothetical protein
MYKYTIEVDEDTVAKLLVQDLKVVKHDMLKQLDYIKKETTQSNYQRYMGIFDSQIDQDEIEIRDFIRAVELVSGYYGSD